MVEPRSYIVHFERVGRHHNLPPLSVWGDADYIAHCVYQVAKKHLANKHPEVIVNLERLEGFILCGFHTGGSFTIEPIGKAVPS